MGTNNWIALTVWWSIKYFFCSKFVDILDKAGRKMRRRRRTHKCKALCVSCKSNNILLCVMWLDKKYRWNCIGNTWTNTLTFIYIENVIKTSFICFFIVTAKNLIWLVVFWSFYWWWSAEEYFICSTVFILYGTQMWLKNLCKWSNELL